jgi:hypothetical protein
MVPEVYLLQEHPDWPAASFSMIGSVVVLSIFLWEFFYVRTLMPRLGRWAKRQSFFESLAQRSGHLSHCGQEDVILMFVLAVHHMTAGSLTLLGHIFEWPFLFRTGALLELGFELSDTVAMLRGAWPHARGRESSLLTFALLAHHLPGLFLTVPVLRAGVDANPHIRAVASWLLFAGGVSALCGGFVHTCNFEVDREMKQAALAQGFGGAFFIYARFLVFPREIYRFARELESERLHRTMPYMIRVFTVAMLVFNLIVLRHNLAKTIKFSMRAMGQKNVEVYDLRDTPKSLPKLKGYRSAKAANIHKSANPKNPKLGEKLSRRRRRARSHSK